MSQVGEMDGIVEQALPKGLYKVRCDDGKAYTVSLGANARRFVIGVVPGDRVVVEVSALDPTRGRIKARKI